MIDRIELTYDLRPLPPGRVPFSRFRWELWHGSRLLAAGWRVSLLHAQRAVRRHALHHAHRVNGLHQLRPDEGQAPEGPWLGRQVKVQSGAVSVLLTPLLDEALAAAG